MGREIGPRPLRWKIPGWRHGQLRNFPKLMTCAYLLKSDGFWHTGSLKLGFPWTPLRGVFNSEPVPSVWRVTLPVGRNSEVIPSSDSQTKAIDSLVGLLTVRLIANSHHEREIPGSLRHRTRSTFRIGDWIVTTDKVTQGFGRIPSQSGASEGALTSRK